LALQSIILLCYDSLACRGMHFVILVTWRAGSHWLATHIGLKKTGTHLDRQPLSMHCRKQCSMGRDSYSAQEQQQSVHVCLRPGRVLEPMLACCVTCMSCKACMLGSCTHRQHNEGKASVLLCRSTFGDHHTRCLAGYKNINDNQHALHLHCIQVWIQSTCVCTHYMHKSGAELHPGV
jgi:hypothetical protein